MPARLSPFGIARIVLVIAGLFQAGCGMRIASIKDRRASFAPHAQSKIDSELLPEFLARRTAFVIGGDNVGIILPVKSRYAASGRFSVRALASRFSTAAAIDSRGYFLTASHAFETKAPFLAYYEKHGIRVAPTRVVWRGDFSKGEPDLALLRVPRRLESAFEWSSDARPEPLAFAAGFDSSASAKFNMACIAGRVVRVTKHPNLHPPSTEIFHLAPLHPGDSGGPLTSPDGRLLGINTEIELSIFRPKPLGIAERPDVNWVRDMIERDVKKHD